MSVIITYNGQEVLAGQPTPIVGKSESMIRYGERWAELSTITLRGQITGCPNNFNGLISEQVSLIDIFSKDFQSLRVTQDGNVIHDKPFCLIREGVRFPNSNYNGILEYEVVLDCYEENLFSGVYGVLDPEDSWSFEEGEDRTLTATRTVSARGFNTSSGASNAFQHAVDFVNSKTGDTSYGTPYFINLPSGFGICLRTVRENPNRFNGTYGVTLTYEGDLYYNQGGVLRYTTSTECDTLNGITTVSVEGEVNGCAYGSISDVRNRYWNFNIPQAAQLAYSEFTSSGSLNSGYLTSGVVEQPFTPSLNFNVSFDNFTGSGVYFDYRTNIVSGENGVVSVTVDGNIVSRGQRAARWQAVSGFYNTLNLFSYANAAYTDFAPSGPSLNTQPNASGVTYNQFAGEIRTNASWDNKQSPVSGFSKFNYNLEFLPSLERVVAKPLATNSIGPICSSAYAVIDLGYKNRAFFTMHGEGVLDCSTSVHTALTNLKAFANNKFTEFCPNTRALLETNVITTGIATVAFTFAWSAESTKNVITPRIDYSNIDDLSLK
jgi:hypothetical protein